VIVYTGHGIQAYWPLDAEDAAGLDNASADALEAAFGRLVGIVAEHYGAKADSVFDLARVLRVPGTLNFKDGHPLPVSAWADTGSPLTPAELAERLREVGIESDPDPDPVGDDVISAPEGWFYDRTIRCGYVDKMLAAWETEPVPARHPWMYSCYHRIAAAHRFGCFADKDEHRAAIKLVDDRFHILISTQDPVRKPGKYELQVAQRRAVDRVSKMSEDRARAELGGHRHALAVTLDESGSEGPSEAETGMPVASLADIIDLERGFWERDSLQIIYTAALARMCSPWAVLACCVARALATVRPNAVLPPLLGGVGSLNWFGAIAALSGGGKGAAVAVARELVTEAVYVRNLGSGEGLVTCFKMKGTDENPDGVRESVMFNADEIDTVKALGQRNGSTLMGTLRSAFSGETLGFAYSTQGKEHHIEAHTYRMTLVCSVQPGRAEALLGDEAGGTPQRFMWFPGIDSRISREYAKQNGCALAPALKLPVPREWQYPRTIILPDQAKDFILEQRERAGRGEIDGLDGHAVFAREKFAYALAVLDGRVQMSSEDWELSGIAADVSRATRDWVARGLAAVQRRDAERQGETLGVKMAAADKGRADAEQRRLNRIADWVVRKLGEAGADGMTEGAVHRDRDSRDRRDVQPSLFIALAEQNRIEKVGDDRWRKV
jgi:hypothetical protein